MTKIAQTIPRSFRSYCDILNSSRSQILLEQKAVSFSGSISQEEGNYMYNVDI